MSARSGRGPALRIGLGVLGASAIALALWAFAIEPSSLRVREYPLAIEGWPRACNGLRVAVLADLHVGAPWRDLAALEALVDATQASAPDLVLAPGDFVIQGVVGGTFIAPEAAAEVLARLDAPLGTWAVLGNHDHWLDAGRVETALAEHGIGVLEDRSTTILRGDCHFALVGVSDLWEGAHDVEAALAGTESAPARLLITHNPDLFAGLTRAVTLTIAGHTHGGQVDLPMLGRLVVPSRFGERYAAGHVVEDGRHLFVSTGVGTSILPVRFRVPPEVSLLTLSAP